MYAKLVEVFFIDIYLVIFSLSGRGRVEGVKNATKRNSNKKIRSRQSYAKTIKNGTGTASPNFLDSIYTIQR